MTLWLVSIFFFVASNVLGSVKYITTVLNLRTRGMSLTKLPLTIWALFMTATLSLLTFPVLLAATNGYISGQTLNLNGG